MTALFFLLSAAAIGLPGTLPFVSEDLLLHGLLHTNIKGAIALLAVTVLNGITLLRVFFDVFQGPTRERRPERRGDLTPREAIVIGGLLLVTLIAGLSPRILLALQDHSVRALSSVQPGAEVPRASTTPKTESGAVATF
jgi:NADH-quinone oxidoreductase subunit M